MAYCKNKIYPPKISLFTDQNLNYWQLITQQASQGSCGINETLTRLVHNLV